MLYAATKKRRQRATTTAAPEDLGEVPGVGVPLALVVILLLHVAAIAGIWIHDQWSESADLEATKPALKEDVQPERINGLDSHLVSSGETVDSIASQYGVDREALLKANQGISEYQAGWKINIPNQRAEVTSPSGSLGQVVNLPNDEPIYTPRERPEIQTANDQSLPGSEPGPLTAVGDPSETDEPVLIRPVRVIPNNRVTPSAPPVQSGTRTHTVKSGDTLYGIARKNGVSVAELQRANPGVNVSALRIGASLKIPATR